MASNPVIHQVRGLLLWWLRRSGYRGITLPPWGIFILPGSERDAGLIAHESVHWAQYERLGAVIFYITYTWGLLRYGYERHPMEIEARQISGYR